MKNAFVAISVLAMATLAASPSHAVTTHEAEFVCPIDGTAFRSLVFTSFYIADRRLDSRPVYGGSPQFLPKPECPGNGFIIYKAKFDDDEIRKAKKFIETIEFTAMRRDHVSSARAALIAEQIGDDTLTVSWLYLQAAWEAEDLNKSVQEQEAYLGKSLTSLEAHLAGETLSADRWQGKLLAAELSRRVGHFEAALAHLANLALEANDLNAVILHKVAEEIARLARQGIRSPALIPR